MAEKKNVASAGGDDIIAKAQDFWTRYQKQLTIALTVIVLAVGGWFGYKNFIQKSPSGIARPPGTKNAFFTKNRPNFNIFAQKDYFLY